MFRLDFKRHKRSRGIKTLAAAQFVSVSDYVLPNEDGTIMTVAATIEIRGDGESYYLAIPDDKLASVITRLQAIQNQRIAAQASAERQAEA